MSPESGTACHRDRHWLIKRREPASDPSVDIDRVRRPVWGRSNSSVGASRRSRQVCPPKSLADDAVLLNEHARPCARNCTTLLPCSGTGGALRSTNWRLFVNA